MKINQAAEHELQVLLEEHGRLRPRTIVKHARSPKSALHAYFDWDLKVAAQSWWEHQARQILISVRIEIPNAQGAPIRVREYVSLPSERATGGGYRPIRDVMSNARERAELLESALKELRRVQFFYGSLKELTAVFAAVERATSRHARKKGGSRKAA